MRRFWLMLFVVGCCGSECSAQVVQLHTSTGKGLPFALVKWKTVLSFLSRSNTTLTTARMDGCVQRAFRTRSTMSK